MSLFVRLPVASSDASLPTIPKADIDYLSVFDPTSYEHWLFDKGNSEGLTGLSQSKVLTVQGAVPTYGENYLELQGAAGNALLSDLMDDNAAPQRTLCAVVREPAFGGAGQVRPIFGTIGSSTGGSLYFQDSTSALSNIKQTYRGVTGGVDTGKTATPGLWYFAACAINFASAQQRITSYIGGQGGQETLLSGKTYLPSNSLIALGNGYYAGSGYTLQFAELIIFDASLSIDDIASVYAKSKARMADRGITIA